MLIHATILFVSLFSSFAGLPQAKVEGGLDKPAVREVVRANIDDVRHCYNAELRDDETLAGRVVISFVVNPDGTTSKIHVSESTMPKRFDACMVEHVATWSFPKADAATSVVYPFEMEPG